MTKVLTFLFTSLLLQNAFSLESVVFKKKQASIPTTLKGLDCKNPGTEFLLMNRNAEDALTEVFNEMSCSNATNYILSSSQLLMQCQAVRDCDKKVSQYKSLTKDDQHFLKYQAAQFVIRENVDWMMSKYSTDDSKSLRQMTDHLKQMPKEFQDKINYCKNSDIHKASCLDDPENDYTAKNYISVLTAKENAKKTTFAAFSKNLGLEINNDAFNAERIEDAVVLMTSKEQKRSGKDFDDLREREKKREERTKLRGNGFDPESDQALEFIYNEVKVSKKRNPGEVAAVIQGAIDKFISSSNDHILGHYTIMTPEYIEQSIMHTQWSEEDLDPKNSVKLSKKINDIRVAVANKIFNEECSRTVISIDQLCSNVSDMLKNGSSIKSFLNENESPLKSIIDSLKSANLRNTENIISRLEDMAKSKRGNYDKYLKFIFNYNNCQEMYPDLFVSEKTDDDYRAYLDKQHVEQDAIVYETKKDTASSVEETIRRDPQMRREFAEAKIKIPDSVKERILEPEEPKAIEHKPEVKQIEESVAQKNAVTPTTNQFVPQPSPQHDVIAAAVTPVIQPTQRAIEHAPVKTEISKDKLAKLKSLEKEEAAIRKKIADASTDSANTSSRKSTEIDEMLKQVEELKAKQAAVKTETSTAVEPKSEAAPKIRTNTEREQAPSRMEPEAAQASISTPTSKPVSASPSSVAAADNSEKFNSALTLTKNGEIAIDLTTILENPDENAIAKYALKSNGQPFFIRENGELVQVTPLLDEAGKPIKGKFKKSKLNKAQQAKLAKLTIPKDQNHIEKEKVRLKELKLLMNSVSGKLPKN